MPLNSKHLVLRDQIISEIQKKKGWANCHSHLDRAYTINPTNLKYINATLQEKWELNDSIKRKSTVDQIYDRMAYAIEKQIAQGVTSIGSFIDVDEVIKDKSILAAMRIREKYKKNIQIKYINQVLKGVINKEAYKWFLMGAEFVDIIGGLPERDKGKEKEHIEILFDTARRLNKSLHIHVDQFNSPMQKDTELLCDLTIKNKLQGRVMAVHAISLSAQSKKYRKKVYQKLKKADITIITCPTAWIDSRRSEELAVTHNSIAPVEELILEGIPVALGTDNIFDIYKPFSDGDMWTELRFLLESCHFYDTKELINIATRYGRASLGIS